MTERELQTAVLELAHVLGYRAYHTHDSRRSNPGFPDLVMVRKRVIFAELKSDAGKLSDAQMDWMDQLRYAGAEVHVWRPEDWTSGEIERTLQAR